jgi:iron complex transport system ATP-binding protein
VPTELTADSITAGYGRWPVLRGVSCTFPAGALTCILGPNAAGKTTLLRVLSGLLRPQSGGVLFDGADLHALPPRARARRVALVPQLAQDALPLTVQEAVAIARYPQLGGRFAMSGADRRAVCEALETAQLTHKARARCGTLSGGEWRRLLIAQGLAQQTPVLLLDEPTAHLDPPARYEMLRLLATLAHQRGLLVVTVLHDPLLALQHADTVVLLREGQVLRQGPARDCVSYGGLRELYEGPADWLEPLELRR